MLSFTLSDANGSVISSSYAYDALNRMTSATNNTVTETYTYDNNGNLTARTNPAVSVTNQYNNANWNIRTRTTGVTTADILGYYNYDGTLARTRGTYNNATSDVLLTNYSYDGLNRMTLESVTARDGNTISSYSDEYTFDDNNNRATLDTGSYTYDANNRMLTSPESNYNVYYDDGSLLTDSTFIYEYDGFNRLVQVKDFNTDAVVATYTYNGDGQRITKTVNGVTTTYVWNGDYIVYETTSSTEQKYYYGLGLYAMEDNADDVYYYGKNIHGDIVELYDEDGESVFDYRYNAFGNQLITNTGDTNPFRYAGEYYDNETGFIYLRNRYYDTKNGRFITEDPIRDGLNWYVYCSNNPVMFVDPSGMIKEKDDELSNTAQIIINGPNKDGKGGLSLAWTNADEEHRVEIELMADKLRAFDRAGGDFTNVHYLLAPEGAKDLGHAAVMLEKHDGSGLLFSFYPSPASSTLTKSTITDVTVHFAVLSSGEVSNVLNGIAPTTVGVYWDWGSPKGYALTESDGYTESIGVSITYSQGLAIYKKAAEITANPGKYMLLARQCNDVALDILYADGNGIDVTRQGVGIPINGFEAMSTMYGQ